MTLQCSKETVFEPMDLQAQIMVLTGLNNNVVSCADRLLRSCIWLITGVTFKLMPVWSTSVVESRNSSADLVGCMSILKKYQSRPEAQHCIAQFLDLSQSTMLLCITNATHHALYALVRASML